MASIIFLPIIYFLSGIFGGLLSSAPLGPINLWVARSCITRRNNYSIIVFIFGVITADLFLAWLAVEGYTSISKSPYFSHAIAIIGAVFLIFIGLRIWFGMIFPKKTERRENASEKKIGYFNQLIAGLFLCISNPGFLLFWVFVLGLLQGVFHEKITIILSLFFLIGIMLGDTLWFSGLVFFVKRKISWESPTTLKYFQITMGSVFLILGIVAVFRNTW